MSSVQLRTAAQPSFQQKNVHGKTQKDFQLAEKQYFIKRSEKTTFWQLAQRVLSECRSFVSILKDILQHNNDETDGLEHLTSDADEAL